MRRRLRHIIETLLVNFLVFSSLYQLIVYLANLRFWRHALLPPPETVPSVSVIVPLRGKNLDTLALLYRLAVCGPTKSYEVILALEAEDDPAYPIALQAAGAYPGVVRVVISGPVRDHAGQVHNLNAGYQAARGELIAFVDADVEMQAELWNAALAILDDSDIGAAFAPPLVLEPEPRRGLPVPTGGEMLIALYVNHARSVALPLTLRGGRTRALAGGFMIFRRTVLETAGGLLHLLDQSAVDLALARTLRENGVRIALIPVPVFIRPQVETYNEATVHLLRALVLHRAYRPGPYLAWPFSNPLTVGVLLTAITEREGYWWGRRMVWGFAWLRVLLAHELDRLRFGRGFAWTAYFQLLMLDAFITPALWTRALFARSFVWAGRAYHVSQGGKATPLRSTNEWSGRAENIPDPGLLSSSKPGVGE